MTEFVHLHTHSQYSLLDGAVKVKDLVKRVAGAGMRAVAVTDHGNMFGAITLYKAAKEAGVQAILGCELEVAGRGGNPVHLPALAGSAEGYKNLVWLASRAHVSGAPLALDEVRAHARGLVVMTGCMGGLVPQAILEEGETRGRETLGALRDALEPGSLYVELQDHGLPEQPVVNEILVKLAREIDLPLVATNDVHYGERGDAEAHLYLSCIKTGRTVEEARERHHGSSEMFLKSPDEMAQLFSAHPDAVKATMAIAERCSHLKLDLGKPMLPNFKVPEGFDTEGYFRHIAREGLEKRFEELAAAGKKFDRDAYLRRLETELDVIAGMKFPGYFLIVWDFIRHAKENGIPVGPGRGSGAGSIVAYSMRITDLDPIEHSLFFERFLNPERISMPDFDVDFCMEKRDQVIAYVQQKYGVESVGQIATFAELKSKSVVKDVARCIGITPVEAQQIANLIPRKTPAETYTIAESLDLEPKLKEMYERDARIKELLDTGRKLEGLTRHAGKHAAGIVISEGPLWDHVPVFRDEKSGALVTQYYMSDVEAAGLVKFDFLGLKTLTVLEVAVRLVDARPDMMREGRKLDLSRIPMDDRATYALLGSGETKGVFQLESDGMQRLFTSLQADSFEDIVAAVALYRPGPMGAGMHEDFVRRKHGKAPIVSLHPLIDEIVKPTYGVIVYQEQVMQIAQKLAGYTLGGADLLRRAMGKKKPEEMAKQKSVFIEGAKNNGVDAGEAERIFGLLEYFAGYGFNKCVIGETRIVDASTGEDTTVGDLFARPRSFTVHALGEDGKLHPRRVERVMRNGRKPVFELRTAQGKRIVATSNHPFRTYGGWTNLGDLRVGDRVAAVADLAATDVLWDRVVSIEPVGEEETFDLTVAVDHNFVADGLVVHNSHSAAYALITYQTAWLKAHYPVELLCAILTSDKDRIDKVVRTIADARAMGVTVLPPDVNESDTDFKVVYTHPDGARPVRRVDRIKDKLGPQIRFGLGAVRGLGGAALEAVFEARRDGPFRDLFDLAARVDAKRVNKAVFEALVQCGAFDTTLEERGVSRARAFASVDIALERARAASRDREAGQTSMFGMFDAAAPKTPAAGAAPSAGDYTQAEAWDRRELLVRERQSLGFYVSGHPLERYVKGEAGLAKVGATPLGDCAKKDDWAVVKIAGMVEGYRERIFKDGGGKIAFFELEDITGRISVKVRAREIDQFAPVLQAGEPVLVEGKVSYPQRAEDEVEEPEGPREPTILLNNVRPLAEAVRADTRSIAIRLRADRTGPADLDKLARVLTGAKGSCPVALYIGFPDGAEAVLTFSEAWRVEVGDPLLSDIERVFGEQVAELR